MIHKAHSYISTIPTYNVGRTVGELAARLGVKLDDIVRLAVNENPHGMSPAARQAVADAIADGSRYPEVSGWQKTLAKHLAVEVDQVIPGSGSCEILELTARAFLRPGAQSVFSVQSFPMYRLGSLYMGATCVEVPVRPRADYTDDLEGLLRAITPQTHLVWISNINNPCGSMTPFDDLKQLITSVPKDVVVLLDEAYTEYLPDSQQVDTIPWTAEFSNLIISRTFSKIYGMAGMRVGYGVASAPLAAAVNRMRGPYNCNTLGIAAGVASLADDDYLALSRTRNNDGTRQLTKTLKRLGLSYVEPHANFVTIKVGDGLAAHKKLLERGVVVLPLNGYQMPEHIRVTVGLESEIQRFTDALPACL